MYLKNVIHAQQLLPLPFSLGGQLGGDVIKVGPVRLHKFSGSYAVNYSFVLLTSYMKNHVAYEVMYSVWVSWLFSVFEMLMILIVW